MNYVLQYYLETILFRRGKTGVHSVCYKRGFFIFYIIFAYIMFSSVKLDQMEMVFTLTGNFGIVILFGQSRTYQFVAKFF